VALLLDAGYDVRAVGRGHRGIPEHRDVKVVRWNLLDPRGPEGQLGDVRAVVHLAARIPGPRGLDEGDFSENLVMTTNLLAHLQELRHVVFASTIDVYGRPRSLPIREDHPTEPLTAYGRSKVACERYLQEASAVRGYTLTVLRLAQVYGPGERPMKAIPRFVEAIRAGRPPVIYGDGSDLRDYVYVDDAARAIALALEREVGGLFNISSGQPHSIRKVLEILAHVVPADIRPVFADRPGEKFDFWMDNARAKEILGFGPQVALPEGLRRQYEWAVSEAAM
jgi:UDP-glucose 4-epimerase